MGFRKVFIGGLALFLFILAINIMKEGASGGGRIIENLFRLDNPWNSLGFGWLGAVFVLSGSPIAATALALFDTGILDEIESFTMIIGSRFGTSIVLLLMGFYYHSRGHEKHTSLSVGIISILVKLTLFPLAMVLGIFFLQRGTIDRVQFTLPPGLISIIDAIFVPLTGSISKYIGGLALFFLGVALIIISFKLVDSALPRVNLEKTSFRGISKYIYNSWVMFMLGLLITLVTTSVSVSLGILVPLSARGYIKAQNLIPYIMGANISTFIDTLAVAILLGNPGAFTIVWAQMVSIAISAIIILLLFSRRYEKFIIRTFHAISRSNRNLTLLMVLLLLTPIVMLII